MYVYISGGTVVIKCCRDRAKHHTVLFWLALPPSPSPSSSSSSSALSFTTPKRPRSGLDRKRESEPSDDPMDSKADQQPGEGEGEGGDTVTTGAAADSEGSFLKRSASKGIRALSSVFDRPRTPTVSSGGKSKSKTTDDIKGSGHPYGKKFGKAFHGGPVVSEACVAWSSAMDRSKTRLVPLTNITELWLGQVTQPFDSAGFPQAAWNTSLSLITPQRSVDVVFPSQSSFDMWVDGLKEIVPNLRVSDQRRMRIVGKKPA